MAWDFWLTFADSCMTQHLVMGKALLSQAAGDSQGLEWFHSLHCANKFSAAPSFLRGFTRRGDNPMRTAVCLQFGPSFLQLFTENEMRSCRIRGLEVQRAQTFWTREGLSPHLSQRTCEYSAWKQISRGSLLGTKSRCRVKKQCLWTAGFLRSGMREYFYSGAQRAVPQFLNLSPCQ